MKNNLIHIRGLITPALWDETGKPLRISLSTFNEEVYLIDDDKKGKELMTLIREEVEIKGEIIRKDHIKRIRVKEFIKNSDV